MLESKQFDAVDEAIARKLREVPVPLDLRDRILASRPAAREAVSRGGVPVAALAAAIALALVVFGVIGPAGAGSLQVASEDMVTFLDSNFSLALKTRDLGTIEDWLASHAGPGMANVPPVMDRIPPVGCREIEWRGHKGALVCFEMKDGKIAHLMIFPSETFSDVPNSQSIARVGDWRRTAWSSDGMTFLLFSPWDSGTPV